VVKDTNVNEHDGTFTDWKLTLWGECIDPSTQELLPMPTENDDDDHDVISAEVSTATVSTRLGEASHLVNPTDHPNRPVNAKPTANTKPALVSAPGTPTATASASTSVAAILTGTSDNLLPHYFPTFGVSKRTQIWIYGALAIIVLFCAGLGTYFYVQRQKRLRNSRDKYEFEMLDDQEGIHTGGIGGGGGRGARARKRAGELYDAFAGESDEELLSDEEVEGQYMDEVHDTEEDRGRRQLRQQDHEKT
jgi:kexin